MVLTINNIYNKKRQIISDSPSIKYVDNYIVSLLFHLLPLFVVSGLALP